MRDKLENFVREHLNEFDTKEPDIKLWSLIEKKLDAISGKTDSLEQFIHANREQFNNKLPNSDIWSKVDRQISPTTKVRKINFLRLAGIAASVVFLMLASAVAGIHFYGGGNGTDTIAETDLSIDKDIPTELLELEKMYQKRVDRKHGQLTSYNHETSEALSTVNQDLSKVDEIIDELRVELLNAPKGSEEQIINAMARNYETKLKILEIVLKRIRTTDSKKDNEDEGISM